jgi:hypothetical protein
MKFEKIIVAVDLDQNSVETLGQIRQMHFPADAEIHLVHVFEQVPNLMDLSFVFTPSEKDLAEIQLVILKKLEDIRNILGLNDRPKTYLRCLLSSNPKQEFLQYVDSVGPDLVVAAAEEKSGFVGLFEGSFTNFLSKFCRANLLLLRPQPEKGIHRAR